MMYDDTINNLLKGVADGSISVKDARSALEGVELTEAQMDEAINHGVHNVAESGTIVSASLAPSGGSYLTMFFFAWGIFWSCYWAFSLIYGLAKSWDQQQLAFPSCHDTHNAHSHGCHLSQIHPTGYNYCQTFSEQICS